MVKTAVIVIPTYNESNNMERLLLQIFDVVKKIKDWRVEVLVVDSESPDGTAKKVMALKNKYPKLHLLSIKKLGLGKAYIEGFNYAITKLKPYVLFEMDADLSHDPGKIPAFLKKINGGADFVIGSRYIKGGSIPKDWGIHRKIFSILGNLIIRFGFMKLKISDWTSGYRAIKSWVVQSAIPSIHRYGGYVFQVALADTALKRGAVFAEVPINFVDRTHGKSKINSIQYIIQTLFYVFTHSSFIRYAIVGLIGFGLDFGISYLLIERTHLAIWLATVVSAETAIISNFLLNNFWSFSYKKIEPKLSKYLYKFIKFNFVTGGALLIQAIGIQTLAYFFGRRFWYVYKILIIAFIVIPYSYFMYNRVIWKEKR